MDRFVVEVVPQLVKEANEVPKEGSVFLNGLISRVSDALEVAKITEAACRSILMDQPNDDFFLDYQKEANRCVQNLDVALAYLVSIKEQTWIPLD